MREGFPVVVLLIMIMSGCDASLGLGLEGWPNFVLLLVKRICV